MHETKKSVPFCLKSDLFLDGGSPYFLNKALDKPYNRTYKPS